VATPLQLQSLEGVLHAETDGEYISAQSFEVTLHTAKIKLLAMNKA
jgi:hypothetical protein